MWEVRWIFHQIELPIENEISTEISCTSTRTCKVKRNWSWIKTSKFKSKRKLAGFQCAKLNKWHDVTSSHHIETSCHLSLPQLNLPHHFVWNHFGWHYNSSPPIECDVFSLHRCLLITSHLKWPDLTSLLILCLPFHRKSSYITAFYLVSSCLIWKNVSWCSSQAQRNTSLMAENFLLLLWSFEATNFES